MAQILIVEDEERIASFVAKGSAPRATSRPSRATARAGSTRRCRDAST